MRYTILFVAALAIVAQGCGTLAPAVYGKTTYDMKFGDKLSPAADGTGGQDTTFSVFVKAPSGVKIEDLVSMGYDWTPDSGKIAVSKQASQDTTGQVEIIKAAIEAQTAAFNTGVTAGAGLLGIAIPEASKLIGQHMDIKGAQAQVDSANRFQLGQQLILSIDQIRAGVQSNIKDPAFREWLMDLLTRPTTATGATEASP